MLRTQNEQVQENSQKIIIELTHVNCPVLTLEVLISHDRGNRNYINIKFTTNVN